jgi:hypothetical protein
MHAAERVHQLGQGIYGREIDRLGSTVQGDDYLLTLIGHCATQAPNILVDPVDDPLEEALRIEFARIPIGALDDARDLHKHFRSAGV